jgi:hypothetical protein
MVPNVLIEIACKCEHACHNGDLACVPTADVLVELGCLKKHSDHGRHFACVPTANVLVNENTGFHTVSCDPVVLSCELSQSAYPTSHA